MKPKSASGRYQSGAALIVALLVVALVTAIATSMASDYIVTVKRASNQLVGEQAWSYLRGAEAFAIKFLRVDHLSDPNNNDGCDDIWAEETDPFMLEDGAYGGQLQDLQGKFNINSLMPDPTERRMDSLPRTVQQARFLALLQSFNDDEFTVTQDEAQSITEAVLDWLDPDQNALTFSSAEDSYYESLDDRRPYRAADTRMQDASELLQIAHMTPQLYEKLLPHVTVWPLGGGAININTATENVLLSLNVPERRGSGSMAGAIPVKPEDLSAVMQLLMAEGFSEVSMLADQPGFEPTLDTEDLVVTSAYFVLHAAATLGDLTIRSYSTIYRNPTTGEAKVIKRSASGSSVINSCVSEPPT